jgi:5-methylthioribose kinase
MRELTSENAGEYLLETGRALAGEPIAVRELAGGVSNVVLLVELAARGERFVLKQARDRLRVKEEWLCPIERIWREVETLRVCGKLLTPLRIADCGLRIEVPDVLWEDRENYCFAMTAAPPEHKTWKELLLAGDLAASAQIAAACGRMLGAIHAGSWGDAQIAAEFDDRTFFDLLRIDPYYRHVAKVHPDIAPQLQRLIDSVWSHRQCLVHGDFSPKNLLVWNDRVMLIDCEVGHYGDPAFDLGFFLTHLILKAIWAGTKRDDYLRRPAGFWTSYRARMAAKVAEPLIDDLERRAMWNLAGCMLARVDGKSPVEYLSEAQRDAVRGLSQRWIEQPPATLEEAAAQLAGRV